MRSTDVPQADDLGKVRAVVAAIAADTDPGLATGLCERHVQYHRHAARVLGLLRPQPWRVTDRGSALLLTEVGSREEADALRSAILDAEGLGAWFAGVARGRWDEDGLTGTIQASVDGLSATTARRRAQTVLRWVAAVEARNPQPALFVGVFGGGRVARRVTRGESPT